MAREKKSSNGKKFNIIEFSAYLALVIAAVLFLTNAILSIFDGTIVGKVAAGLSLIKDISLFVAIALGGYSYSKNRTKLIRVMYWVALVVYIGCVFFGLGKLVF